MDFKHIADDHALVTVFDFNERAIWDSGFGYETGCFLGEGVAYATLLATGLY